MSPPSKRPDGTTGLPMHRLSPWGPSWRPSGCDYGWTSIDHVRAGTAVVSAKRAGCAGAGSWGARLGPDRNGHDAAAAAARVGRDLRVRTGVPGGADSDERGA